MVLFLIYLIASCCRSLKVKLDGKWESGLFITSDTILRALKAG